MSKFHGHLNYALVQGFRPRGGIYHHAHEAAVLTLSGLIEGAIYPGHALRTVIGDTSIAYHLRQGNFERVQDSDKKWGGYKLTDIGKLFFARKRSRVDAELYSAFLAVLSTGVADPRVIEEPESIVALV